MLRRLPESLLEEGFRGASSEMALGAKGLERS